MKMIAGLIILTFMLNGCSVFGLASAKQRVVVDRTASDTITVTFCGNAYMSQKEVERYALQRASVEAISKGCPYFMIVDKMDKSKMCALNYEGTGKKELYDESEPLKAPLDSQGFVEPNVTLTIKCVRGRQEKDKEAIDAKKFLEENFPGINSEKTGK